MFYEILLLLCDFFILARKFDSLENDKMNSVYKKVRNNLKSFINNNENSMKSKSILKSDELSEGKKKIVDTMELIQESRSNSDEHVEDNNQQKISQNSEEN